MSSILSFLKNLQLTAQQWLAALAATVIGALVVAMKVQGSLLHKAQINVLKLTLKPKLDQDQFSVDKAQQAYDRILQDYLSSGGKLVLTALLLSSLVQATPQCSDVLKGCDDLIKTQAQQIVDLKDANAKWEKMAKKGPSDGSAPTVVGSLASGAAAGAILGGALGLGLGAAVGVSIGFIIDEVF